MAEKDVRYVVSHILEHVDKVNQRIKEV